MSNKWPMSVIVLCKESRTVLDSGFHALDSEFEVLESSLHHWNLDTGFQSLVGFRNP